MENEDYKFETKIDSRTDFGKGLKSRIDSRTDFGKGLKSRIDSRTDFGKEIYYKTLLQWKKSCNIIKSFMKE